MLARAGGETQERKDYRAVECLSIIPFLMGLRILHTTFFLPRQSFWMAIFSLPGMCVGNFKAAGGGGVFLLCCSFFLFRLFLLLGRGDKFIFIFYLGVVTVHTLLTEMNPQSVWWL